MVVVNFQYSFFFDSNIVEVDCFGGGGGSGCGVQEEKNAVVVVVVDCKHAHTPGFKSKLGEFMSNNESVSKRQRLVLEIWPRLDVLVDADEASDDCRYFLVAAVCKPKFERGVVYDHAAAAALLLSLQQ